MTENIPQWIEHVGSGRGRDHLGIQVVGQTMLEYLTSGYSNITQRLRYFSFYTWIIKSFFDSSLPKNENQFNSFLKEKIFLYTVSNGFIHANEGGTGIDGIEFVRKNFLPYLEKNQNINLEKHLKKFQNNYWIYKSKLSDLGLTNQNMDKSGIPSLSASYGKQLAQAFKKSFTLINPLELNLENISVNELEKLESQWCYDQLNKSPEELQLLEDILFARVKNTNNKALNRRYSLVLFLMHIKENQNLKTHSFELWLNDSKTFPPNLDQIKKLWQIFFLRNRQVFAMESIFFYFLSLCKNSKINHSNLESSIKISLENDLENNIQSKLIFDFWEKPLALLLNELKKKNQKEEKWSEILIADKLRNISYAKRLTMETDHLSSGFLNLLAIYNHFKKNEQEGDAVDFKNIGQTQRYSIQAHIKLINQYLEQKLAVREVIRRFLQEELLARHQMVASGKFYDSRKDTFHFTVEDNFYLIHPIAEHFTPQYNAMKFNQVTNFFEDLNLIKINHDSKNIELNAKGYDIIEEFYE